MWVWELEGRTLCDRETEKTQSVALHAGRIAILSSLFFCSAMYRIVISGKQGTFQLLHSLNYCVE